MPFDNEDEKSIPQKKGVKLSNKNSTIPQPQNNRESFEEAATKAFSTYEDYKQRTWDLSLKFKSFIEDKSLPSNKSILSKDLEKEVLDNLVKLASEMNADENQPEGIGSIAMGMLMMKMMLLQRDTINSLSHKLEKLEKTLSTQKPEVK